MDAVEWPSSARSAHTEPPHAAEPPDGHRPVEQPSVGRSPDRSCPQHRITLLGGFRLEADGEPLPVPTSAQRLVSLLALRGRCGRSRLAGSLWPDSPEARALATLRTAIWRVNQVAPSLIRSSGDSVALDPDVEVDVAELVESAHTVLSKGTGTVLDAVTTRSVDGDLLPDWTDEWLLMDRERLRQLRLHLLETLAGRLSDHGQFGMAMEAGMSALRADPLRESAHRTVIRIHLAEGNVAEALHAYDECRHLLARDVGVTPTPETTGLVRTIAPGRVKDGSLGSGRPWSTAALTG